MMLTDREWLRFVTFGLIAGATLGASNTGALLLTGQPPAVAMAGGIVAAGGIAALVHVALRMILDRASTPGTATDSDAGVAEDAQP